MKARRFRVIILGSMLAVVGAIVPLAVMGYASWQVAIGRELSALREKAFDVAERASLTFKDVHRALATMNASTAVPCSPEHIQAMRAQTINTASIGEIGYFEGDRLKCTSWGVTGGDMRKAPVDYVAPDGMAVTLRTDPGVSLGKEMMAIHLGKYNAHVVPERFINVGLSPNVSLALFNEERLLINDRNDPDISYARDHADRSGNDGARMFASVSRDGVIAVVSQPTAMMYGQLRSQLIVLLPVGAFISLFIAAMIVVFSRRRLSPRAELETAVQRREFVVHYQPIIELATGACVGAEALVRWKRPDGSLVRPDLFIPLAEETGLILPITDQVVEMVVQDLNAVLVNNRNLHIAVNLCAADIKSGRFLDMIADKLRDTGIRNEQIWLEATERGFLDVDAASTNLEKARNAGHAIAIDDFGTGYSSLRYLQNLPMDALKIDKSFVDTIGRGTVTSSVTLHIIRIAQELGLVSVAEGIETEEQATYLRAQGVKLGQGWLFSKPLTVDDFINFQTASMQECVCPQPRATLSA